MTATVPALAQQRAIAHGSVVALRFHELGVWRPVTWTALLNEAAEIGAGLTALGVSKGQAVGLLMANHPSWIAAFIGIQGIGAVVAPVDPFLAQPESVEQLEQSQVVAVLCGDQEQFDKVDEGQQGGALKSVRFLVVNDTRGIRSLDASGRSDADRNLTFAQLRSRGNSSSWASSVASVAATDNAVVKGGVQQSHQSVLEEARAISSALNIGAKDRLLCQASLASGVERALSLVGSIETGAVVAIGEGGPLAQAELAAVQPTLLHPIRGFLDHVSAGVDAKIEKATGLRKWALRSGYKRAEPQGSMRMPKLAPLRLIGLAALLASVIWLFVSSSLADPMRIGVILLILLAAGLVAILTGAAVIDPLRRQLGLARVRAVVDSEHGGATMLGALRVPLIDLNSVAGKAS